jgi:hypothetical protein
LLIPVHLDAVESPLLVALDGPSLLVRRAGAADLRLPLRRLARISVRGPVTFAADTLAACLSAGVPVSFLDGQGRSLGQLLPTHRRHQDLAALVDEAVASGRFAALRTDWRAAIERRSLIRAVAALGLRVEDLRARTVRLAAARAVDRLGAPVPTEELEARLEALLDGLLAELLIAEGAGLRFQGQDPDLDLAADLRVALGFELWPAIRDLARYLGRHGAKHRTEPALQARIVRRFEAARPRLERAVAEALAMLRRCLREVLH